MIDQEKNQIIIMWSQHFEMLNQSKKNDKYMLTNALIIDIVVMFVDDFDKFFAK